VKVHGVFPSSSREFRIFTERSISLDRYRRQWRSRYIIHAGRNLPAKEFRYLRTVRVTAAVYPGFRSRREPVPLTLEHRADLRPYTSCYHTSQSPVFLVNSRFTRFHDTVRARVRVTRLVHHIPKLRSNFAEFLRYRYSNVLAYDASPSVVIFSTVAEV